MKKVLLLFALCTVFHQLQAQQLFPPKPADSLTEKLLGKYPKVQPNTQLQLLKPQPNLNEMLSALNTKKIDANTTNFYSLMPVAMLEGYSKMPVVKLDGYDNMPVMRITPGVQPPIQQKSLPGLPTFKTP